MRPNKVALRFVRALLPDGMATRQGEGFAVDKMANKKMHVAGAK